MKNIDNYEREVLELVVHAESFDSILAEFSGSAFVLHDCLRSLLRRNLIHFYEWDTEKEEWKRTRLYDADRMRDYRYQLSSGGMIYRTERT